MLSPCLPFAPVWDELVALSVRQLVDDNEVGAFSADESSPLRSLAPHVLSQSVNELH